MWGNGTINRVVGHLMENGAVNREIGQLMPYRAVNGTIYNNNNVIRLFKGNGTTNVIIGQLMGVTRGNEQAMW